MASEGVAKGAHETEGLETCWEDAQHLGTFHPSSPAEVKSYVRNPLNFSWLRMVSSEPPCTERKFKTKNLHRGNTRIPPPWLFNED